MVPTPEKILHKNGYFWERAVLTGKKPCNLAAFLSSRKTGGSNGRAERREGKERFYDRK
jgi:hypothetical protein